MKTERNPWFDNIKGILIFLVVFGHLIEIYRHFETHTSVLYIYNMIYAFHMPLFIIISGYFFRPNKPEKVIQLTFIFILWQVINGLLSNWINHNELITIAPDSRILAIFAPHWTMWYLIGIIVWSIITPYVLKLRFPLIFILGFAIWISYIDNVPSWFSMRKLINFYPYFLIGYFLHQKNILPLIVQKATSWKSPIRWGALGIVTIFLFLVGLYTKNGMATELLFMRDEYAHYGWSIYKGAVVQILQYASTTVLSISLILLVTQKRKLFIFNNLGIYTLFIYLVHTNIVRVFREHVPEQITNDPILLLVVSLLLSICICWISTFKPIVQLISPLIQPDIKWMLKSYSTSDKNVPKEQ
ncbi:acyltransferase family protein [Litchfieldia alkalitelluris]|uniref:acyltransferase family protein n=1 Tax=Litchfieldia alkalitelluris TaxID=304268 RepID=UPI0009971B8E|nr:acyltransferase family protein [Litchfieldia alkalitelluris]